MPTRLLKTIDLLAGINKTDVSNLTLPVMQLTVTMEIDKELQELVDKGKDGLRWQQLQDVADNYVAPAKKILAKELVELHKAVGKCSGEERQRQIDTATKVLNQIALAQAAGVNAAVEKVWAEACRRSASLSKFKRKCFTKAMVGALTISTSLASMIASGGSNLLGVMVIFKATAELAILVSDIAQSVDEAAGELFVVLAELRAKMKAGEKPSRKDEVLSDASAIIGKMMATVKTADQNHLKFEAKLASLEKNADNLVGALNKGLDKLLAIDTAEPAKRKRIEELAKQNRQLIDEVAAMSKEIENYCQFNESARKEILDWKAKRAPKTAAAIKLGSIVKLATGLGSAARTFGRIAGLPIP